MSDMGIRRADYEPEQRSLDPGQGMPVDVMGLGDIRALLAAASKASPDGRRSMVQDALMQLRASVRAVRLNSDDTDRVQHHLETANHEASQGRYEHAISQLILAHDTLRDGAQAII